MTEAEINKLNQEFVKNGQHVVILSLDNVANIALTSLRDKNNDQNQIIKHAAENLGRELIRKVINNSSNIVYTKAFNTPMALTKGLFYNEDEKVVLVPILRAGLNFARGMFNLIPTAFKGYIHIANDHKGNNVESSLPIIFDYNWPEVCNKIDTNVIVVEGIIASGNTIMIALDFLFQQGFKNIKVLAALSVKETMEMLADKYCTVQFIIRALDPELTAKGYISPGTGDIGDRLHGLKDENTEIKFNKEKDKWMSKPLFNVEECNHSEAIPNVAKTTSQCFLQM